MPKKRPSPEKVNESLVQPANPLFVPEAVSTLEDSIRWAIAYIVSNDPQAEWQRIDMEESHQSIEWKDADIAEFCLEIEEWLHRSMPDHPILEEAEWDIHNHMADNREFNGRELLEIVQRHI